MLLLGNAVAISRDYQDSWVLEGLEFTFLLFVTIYAVTFFSERRTSRMVTLAIVGRTVFLLIPSLKYVWFQGTAIDQLRQYALANQVYNEGHISTDPLTFYAYTPLMHLFFSIFSIVLNVPIVDSMKYVPVLLSPIYPLLTYVIVEKMEFSHSTTILKYALFISSVPFTMLDYIVTGTLFGMLFAFLILSNLILIFRKNDRRYWLICTIFIIALVATHSVTSVILSAILFAIMGLQRFSYFRPKSYLRASAVFAVATTSAAWLVFNAGFLLQEITRQIFFLVPSGTTPPSEHIPHTFFEHIRVNALSAIKSFTAEYGADAFFLLLTLAGLIILLRMWKKRERANSAAIFLLLFGWLVLLLIIIGVLIEQGGRRSLHFARLLYPIFSSLLVLHLTKNTRLGKWIRPVIFLLIILLGTIELYNCQPLVPPANVLYKDLPPNVPLGYRGQVNSIYQRQVVNFASKHVVGRIACDALTRTQIIGLTGYDFSRTILAGYYPLDKSQPVRVYEFFITHIPGKSGTFAEKPQVRTPSLILEAIYNSSIVYTNGESYVLKHNFQR